MFKHLLYEVRGSVAYLTVNRPAARNALNAETVAELRFAADVMQTDGAVRVAILTGAGDKAFVAGADIRELQALTAESGKQYALAGQAAFEAIETLGKPVIAAVNGFALGGGCELAMACAFRIASDTAMFGQPEVKLGLIPGFGGTQRLTRLIGKGRALEMMLTGAAVTAAEAFRIGLVDRVVPAAELMSTAESLARAIVLNAPIALQCVLEAAHRGMEIGSREGQALEAELFARCCGTADMREGTRAFLDKRTAEFHGI